MLAKSPLFTLVVVMTLALGIGFNTAGFSAVQGTLLRPLSGVYAPRDLVQIYLSWPGMRWGVLSTPHYLDLQDRSGDAFEDVAAYGFASVSLSAEGKSERTIAMLVSANFFQTYGVVPILGRPFLPEAEREGSGEHLVLVLGHSFWQTWFGGDPGVLGRSILLNGHSFQVVGVAPADFRGPVSIADVPLFVPLVMQGEILPGADLRDARRQSWLNAVGRLRPGVSVDRAQATLDALLVQLREAHPNDYGMETRHVLVPQNQAGIHPAFRTEQLGLSIVIMVVVTLLLLMACVNVASLFLARTRGREREIGIRTALGAGRGRIVRQLLTESLIFTALGSIAGLVLARLVLTLLARVRPPMDVPWSFTFPLDGTVLVFTFVMSLLAAFLFGTAPALQGSRGGGRWALNKGRTVGGACQARGRRALVVIQMALSLPLLIGSMLFLRSLQEATKTHPGFADPSSLVVASVDPGLERYHPEEVRELLYRILHEVSALPGVTAAGMTSHLPLGLTNSSRGIEIPDYLFGEGEPRGINYSVVTEGYFEAMGVKLQEGRFFSPWDDGVAATPLVVNQHFADRFWPGQSALGKTVRTAGREWTVVGVVETGKYRSLGEEPTEFMFLPHRGQFRSEMTLVVRSSADPHGVLQDVRDLTRALAPSLPVYDARTMREHMGTALLPARTAGTVLGLLGLLGLTLAAVGVYGVMAFSVTLRARELGIRIALGAGGPRVVKEILGEGMLLAAIGMAIGMALALAGSRLLDGLLYTMNPLDPLAFFTVPGILLAVAALASYLPARRAAGIHPAKALSQE